MIGADQLLYYNGKIFNKAKDAEEARANLAMLSGKQHSLISAVCVVRDGKSVWHHIGKARLAMRIVVDGLRLKGAATPHDEVVADQLAAVLSGGDTDITETVSEDALLKLERQAFMSLIKHPATLARLEHMLETGKPLRN